MHIRRSLRSLVCALAVLATAAPAVAYTIYLKDGSRIIAQDKYVVKGELALITMPSGTESSLPAAEIDVARTEAANVSNLGGTAMLIEGGQATDLQKSKPAASRVRLQDLIRKNEAGLRASATAPAAGESPGALQQAEQPTGGKRVLLQDPELAGDIRGLITARGVTAVVVFRGPTARRPLLVFGTTSEGAVFKALLTASNALLELGKQTPGRVDGFQLVCETDDGGLGARFDLSPEDALGIVSGRYEITRYFVDNVEF
jgi:hypothetical protein